MYSLKFPGSANPLYFVVVGPNFSCHQSSSLCYYFVVLVNVTVINWEALGLKTFCENKLPVHLKDILPCLIGKYNASMLVELDYKNTNHETNHRLTGPPHLCLWSSDQKYFTWQQNLTWFLYTGQWLQSVVSYFWICSRSNKWVILEHTNQPENK